MLGGVAFYTHGGTGDLSLLGARGGLVRILRHDTAMDSPARRAEGDRAPTEVDSRFCGWIAGLEDLPTHAGKGSRLAGATTRRFLESSLTVAPSPHLRARDGGFVSSYSDRPPPRAKFCEILIWYRGIYKKVPGSEASEGAFLGNLQNAAPTRRRRSVRETTSSSVAFATKYFRGFWAYFRQFATAYPGTHKRFKTLSY